MSGSARSFVLFQVCLTQILLSQMAVLALSQVKYERNANTTLSHMFKHTVVDTAVACCVACTRDQGCLGVSYSPDAGRCELNGWAEGTMPTLYNTPGVHAYIKGSLCPLPWVRFQGRCYLFSMTARTWTDSRDYCTGMGTQLVDIQSDAENTFFRNMAIGLVDKYLWIGIEDFWGSNTWSNGLSITFTDFAVGHPMQYECVAISSGGDYRWATRKCADRYACSCKTILL